MPKRKPDSSSAPLPKKGKTEDDSDDDGSNYSADEDDDGSVSSDSEKAVIIKDDSGESGSGSEDADDDVAEDEVDDEDDDEGVAKDSGEEDSDSDFERQLKEKPIKVNPVWQFEVKELKNAIKAVRRGMPTSYAAKQFGMSVSVINQHAANYPLKKRPKTAVKKPIALVEKGEDDENEDEVEKKLEAKVVADVEDSD